MSTRANIIVRDEADELIFYRHSDGYPDGTLPSLNQFLDLIKQGQVRDNTGQASGWLILLGADEYGVRVREGRMAPNNLGAGMQWKVGAYEPTTDLHGDIEFLYVVDLETKRIRHRKVGRDRSGNPTIPQRFYSGRFNPTKINSRQPGDPRNPNHNLNGRT